MDEFRSCVELRIRDLGFDVPFDGLDFSIGRACETVRAAINRSDIPDGLRFTLIDMAAGMFLQTKKFGGEISWHGEKLNFSGEVIKSITEGDVSVTFGGGSGGAADVTEQRFDDLVKSLAEPSPEIFYRFRRIAW